MQIQKFVISVVICFLSLTTYCQSAKRALFLGNSYTGVNNLPQITAAIAQSMNDTLIVDANDPGGFTLQNHSANITSLNKIELGNWDYVILQEQSQLPSFPITQVQSEVYPFAHFLDSMINAYNHCCETMFYMTWGRKNGDGSNCTSWPPVCTYQGMDSLLFLRYMSMTYDNNAVVSPVGAVWKFIRQQYPGIELYAGDGSHPSQAGSYAAACCFYTALFRKDPTLIPYNYYIPVTDAANIRLAVKEVVFDSLMKWQIGKYDPVADFNSHLTTWHTIQFDNTSMNADHFLWDFGDGESSTESNAVHSYSQEGNYHVVLTAYSCHAPVSISKPVSIHELDSITGSNIFLYPNPVNTNFFIDLPVSEIADILIVNCLGQRSSLQFEQEGNKTKIDLSTFAAGTYFISIARKTGARITRKLIKL